MSEHYELPQASVNRMIKAALPKSVQVSKEVKHKMAKAAGLFVLYLTDASNEICKKRKRSTVYPDDVLDAVHELEFEELVRPLEQYLSTLRKSKDSKKKSSSKSKPRSKKSKKTTEAEKEKEKTKEAQKGTEKDTQVESTEQEEGGAEPHTKKARVE